MTKECNRCHNVFDVSFFHKHKTNKDGLYGQCKKCTRQKVNSYYKRFEYKKIELIDGEVWKPVVGWEEEYSVSSFGRVKSNERYIFLSNNKKQLRSEQLRKLNSNTYGYPSVGLRRLGQKQIQIAVHILVAEAFIPNPENKPEVNHKDAIKNHCYVENLEWVTRKENAEHASKLGLLKKKKDHCLL